MELTLNIYTDNVKYAIDCTESTLDDYLDNEGYPQSVQEQIESSIAESIGSQEYTIENFSEYSDVSLEDVAKFLEGYFKHGEPWAAYAAIYDIYDMDTQAFQDSFKCEYEDLDDLVRSHLSCYEIPNFLSGCIDFEELGERLYQNLMEDYMLHRFNNRGAIYVFRN